MHEGVKLRIFIFLIRSTDSENYPDMAHLDT